MKALTNIQADIVPGGTKTGTADRAKKLVVSGDDIVDLSGSGTGTNGEILTANGDGTASFQSPVIVPPDSNPVFWMF
jgi:hypothetical protein